MDMHKLANEVLLTKLIEMKLLKGNVTEMMEVCFSKVCSVTAISD